MPIKYLLIILFYISSSSYSRCQDTIRSMGLSENFTITGVSISVLSFDEQYDQLVVNKSAIDKILIRDTNSFVILVNDFELFNDKVDSVFEALKTSESDLIGKGYTFSRLDEPKNMISISGFSDSLLIYDSNGRWSPEFVLIRNEGKLFEFFRYNLFNRRGVKLNLPEDQPNLELNFIYSGDFDFEEKKTDLFAKSMSTFSNKRCIRLRLTNQGEAFFEILSVLDLGNAPGW